MAMTSYSSDERYFRPKVTPPAPDPAPTTPAPGKTTKYPGKSGKSGSDTTKAGSGSTTKNITTNATATNAPTATAPVSTPDYTPSAVQLRGGAPLADLYGITYNPDVIQAKFDAATKAEYDLLRKQYDATANKFYGQMYDTQNTALDTIRKANAQAVATGASRGIQAANELSAILGLEKTNNQTATDLATQRNQLADKEGAAYAKNAVDAFTAGQTASQALAALGSNLYAADVQNNVGQMNYYASMNQAAKALEGAKYTADSNLTGTKYSADSNLAGTKYASDANVKAAGISAQGARDAATIAGKYSVDAAKEANKAQQSYYSYMQNQSTGNAQSDYVAGMNYLQAQYNDFIGKKDYENAAIWYSKLTGLDYNNALRNIKNANIVKADLAVIAQKDAISNSSGQMYRGYQAMMP